LHGYPGRDDKKQAAIEHPNIISSCLAETIQISRKASTKGQKLAQEFQNGPFPAAKRPEVESAQPRKPALSEVEGRRKNTAHGTSRGQQVEQLHEPGMGGM
jgi:hypothetical protein